MKRPCAILVFCLAILFASVPFAMGGGLFGL